MNTIAEFRISYHQVLDPNGQLVAPLPEFAQDPAQLRQLYHDMVFVRALDAKAYALQRTGKMGTYPASVGQEAIGVGYGSALQKTDVFVPYYRSTAAMLQRGVSPHEILLYWGGDERGSDFSGPREDFPINIPIATQCLHAAGVATAFKLRKQARVVATEIGDGGTSKGDFYEAINVAGIWQLPIVFFVNNNQWAISVPSRLQTAACTYAQKAIAAGIEGIQVDGNDVIAIRELAEQAFAKARRGEGATLIEATTYRLCDHTTADDANRYRSKGEVEEAWQKEPIKRLRAYLTNIKAWSEDDEQALQKRIQKEIDEAVQAYSNTPEQTPAAMFDYLYATLPENTQPQREEAIRRGAACQPSH